MTPFIYSTPSGPYLALPLDDLLSDRGQVVVAEKLGADEVAQEEPTAILVLKLAEPFARDAGRGIHKAHVLTINFRQPRYERERDGTWILTAAKLGVLKSAVHEAELAAVVVGIGVIAEGASERGQRGVRCPVWGRKKGRKESAHALV